MNLSKTRGTKKVSYKALRKKAWNLLSQRKRMENPFCVTCGHRPESWKELQLGHFIHSSSLDFELTNLHPQDIRCNHYLHGNLIKYTLFMQEKYGLKEIERLEALKLYRSRGYKISEMELLNIIEREKAKISELEKL